MHLRDEREPDGECDDGFCHATHAFYATRRFTAGKTAQRRIRPAQKTEWRDPTTHLRVLNLRAETLTFCRDALCLSGFRKSDPDYPHSWHAGESLGSCQRGCTGGAAP